MFEMDISEEKQQFINSKVSEGWLHVNLGSEVGEFLISPSKSDLFQKLDDQWMFSGEKISFCWSPENENFPEEDFISF